MARNTLLVTALALVVAFLAATALPPQTAPNDPNPVPSLPTGDPPPLTVAPDMPPGRTFSDNPAR